MTRDRIFILQAQKSNIFFVGKRLKLRLRFKNLTDMMLQEGGSPQTEQQMSEMIKENLTLSVKKGKNHTLPPYRYSVESTSLM